MAEDGSGHLGRVVRRINWRCTLHPDPGASECRLDGRTHDRKLRCSAPSFSTNDGPEPRVCPQRSALNRPERVQAGTGRSRRAAAAWAMPATCVAMATEALFVCACVCSHALVGSSGHPFDDYYVYVTASAVRFVFRRGMSWAQLIVCVCIPFSVLNSVSLIGLSR